jgi:hypothetical protein
VWQVEGQPNSKVFNFGFRTIIRDQMMIMKLQGEIRNCKNSSAIREHGRALGPLPVEPCASGKVTDAARQLQPHLQLEVMD